MMPLQTAGQAVGDVVEGLTTRSPWMLGIILLNLAGIGAAVYFLNVLILGQQGHLQQVLSVQQAEVAQILNTHDREFDALMKMVQNTLDVAAKPLPVPAPPSLAPEDVLPEPAPRRR
jgi:hypothetical protein